MGFLICIARFILSVIYALLKLLKTQNKIIFISRQTNNPSVDFLLLEAEIKKQHPEYKTVFLCKQIKGGIFGKIKYSFHLLRQMYHLATAKVAVLDSYCIAVSLLNHKKSLTVIQLWHALGNMKRFGYALIDKPEGSSSKLATSMRMHKNYDYAVISSLNFKDDFMAGFKITADKLFENPLPRTDLLTDSDFAKKKREEITEKYPILKGKKNILYCPTFRKNPKGDIEALKDLKSAVNSDKYNLIFSAHPVSENRFEEVDVLKFDLSTFELLFVSDYVISDYSTVFYEAALLNLPIFSYSYDWKDYKNNREINFDIENEFPGLFTPDPEKIIKAIEGNEFDYSNLKAFVKQNISFYDGKCTERLARFIFDEINPTK